MTWRLSSTCKLNTRWRPPWLRGQFASTAPLMRKLPLTPSAKHCMRTLDKFAIGIVGLPWLKLTRDSHIHERCLYFADCVKRTNTLGLRILDVGCGSSTALFYLNSYARDTVSKYVGIDMLPPDRLRVRYKNISIHNEFHQVHLDEDWDFGEFDLIWCGEVIEHILDDRSLLSKLRSHLDPHGILIVTTPSKVFVEIMARSVPGYEAVSTIQDGGHVRTGYDLDMLGALANESGLTLESYAWLMPGTAHDVLWHLMPNPSPIAALTRNVRDIIARRNTGFVIQGEPGLYAHRYMTISATFSNRNSAH
jgi:SAM-dependent methyltransferase